MPVVETTWRKWRELHPTTKVVSGDTNFDRDYTNYPYSTYRDEEVPPLFGIRTGQYNSQFAPKHTVLGLFVGDVQKAYPFSRLASRPVINDEVNGSEILIVSELDEKLAIPYERTVDGRVLTFKLESSEPFVMTDNETNSSWDIKGRAVSGELRGKQLVQIPAHNAFWFAWSVFWPETLILDQ